MADFPMDPLAQACMCILLVGKCKKHVETMKMQLHSKYRKHIIMNARRSTRTLLECQACMCAQSPIESVQMRLACTSFKHEDHVRLPVSSSGPWASRGFQILCEMTKGWYLSMLQVDYIMSSSRASTTTYVVYTGNPY